MNRSPRRSLRIQPPLRGRAAVAQSASQTSRPAVRQRPSIPLGHRPPIKDVETGDAPVCDPLPSDWKALYQQFPGLFKVLPWQWAIALALLVGVSLMFGSLL